MIDDIDVKVAYTQLDMVRRAMTAEDYETAHIQEKALMHAALLTIQKHSSDKLAVKLASIALESLEMDFPRWYA